MSTLQPVSVAGLQDTEPQPASAIETGFPIVEVSQLSERESWRKEINRPLYHIHKWWATRLGSVFRAMVLGALSPPETQLWDAFYKRHCFAGKVVLDPFMGSGTTLGEALKLGAKVVGCDINPVSTFLVRQALTRVDEVKLRAALEHLEAKTASQIGRFYTTLDPLSGASIPVIHFFWVKTVATPSGETVPLFTSYVVAQDAYPARKPTAQILCPDCWQITEDRYDATEVTCRSCDLRFNPQVGPATGQYVVTRDGSRFKIKDLLPVQLPPSHRLYAMLAIRPTGEKTYVTPKESDLELYREAERRLSEETLPLPTLPVRPGHNTNQARGYNYLHWRDFFNARQLLCLGILLRAITEIEDMEVQEQMLCLFSSTLEFNNLFCSYKGEGTGSVRHMFSNHILKPERTPLENCVWGTAKSSGTFRSLFESRLVRAKRYLDDPFELVLDTDLFGGQTVARKITVSAPIPSRIAVSWDDLETADAGSLILNGDSAKLPIPDASVDAVITDPPYFDFVHYSELSDFFFAWLSPVLRTRYAYFDRDNSSAHGEVQHKDPRAFAGHLARVLSEAARVLKSDGVLAFSFHHSRPEGWAAIYEAILKAGLTAVAAHPVHAELRSASPKSSAKNPVSLDAILVCRKSVGTMSIERDEATILAAAQAQATELQSAGIALSKTDRFVIAASHTLVQSSLTQERMETVVRRLERLQVG